MTRSAQPTPSHVLDGGVIKTSRNDRLEPVTVALSTCSFTGLASYFIATHTTWVQWTVLAHLVTGVVCTLVLAPYILVHFRRTTGVRRPSVLFSGLSTALLYLAFAATGGWIMFVGRRESETWIYDLHVVASFLFIALILIHLVLHAVSLPSRRKDRSTGAFPNLTPGFFRRVTVANLALLVLIPVIALIYDRLEPAYTSDAAVDDYQYSYGPHPFRPSQTETSTNTFVDKRQIGNSHRCMNCHNDVSRQWIASAHREAALDQTYVSNVMLLEKKRGISATRYCEGCHAPVALLSGELSPGGKHGGVSGTEANIEGVSCMGCHGIESLPHLKGVASFRFQPSADYLFAQAENPLLIRLHDWLLRVRPNQHKLDMGRPISHESKFCASCHRQFMDKDMNDWGWIKMQDEYSAWLESPYSKQHEQNFSSSAATRCQDCHMPLLASDDPSANADGMVRSHHFPGANTLLPLLRNDQQHLATTKTFLQSNKLRVSIDTPHRQDAVQTYQALDERLRRGEDAPYYYYLGESADIQIAVTNQGVGHNFPGGSTDINEAWIEFLVMDAEGQIVYSSGSLQADNQLEPTAYFYGSIPIDRHGAHVWRHDLFNMVGEAYQRVIPAGKSDIVNYRFSVPSWAKSPLTVTATLKYRKLNERYARWALGDRYIQIPVIDLAWDSLSIPLKIRREVELPPQATSAGVAPIPTTPH